jgi:prevent-host-death family protein
MALQKHDHLFTTKQLRDNLSEAINQAAFSRDPVLVTRRGKKVAGIVSISDLVFLDRMKRRRAEALGRGPPADPSRAGSHLAQRLADELFFLG